MPSRTGAVHVATTTRRYKDKTYHSHLLRRTFREDGKVKHETLGNISHLPAHVIDLIRRALKGETLINPKGRLLLPAQPSARPRRRRPRHPQTARPPSPHRRSRQPPA